MHRVIELLYKKKKLRAIVDSDKVRARRIAEIMIGFSFPPQSLIVYTNDVRPYMTIDYSEVSAVMKFSFMLQNADLSYL